MAVPTERFGKGRRRAFSFKSVSGLISFLIGAFYKNTGNEHCPWSPQVPEFLLTYGVISLCCSALAWRVFKPNDTLPRRTKAFYTVLTLGLTLVLDIGLIAWGALTKCVSRELSN